MFQATFYRSNRTTFVRYEIYETACVLHQERTLMIRSIKVQAWQNTKVNLTVKKYITFLNI